MFDIQPYFTSCFIFHVLQILKLNARTKDQTECTINFFLQQIKQQEEAREHIQANGECLPSESQASASARQRGLVIDGRTLV